MLSVVDECMFIFWNLGVVILLLLLLFIIYLFFVKNVGLQLSAWAWYDVNNFFLGYFRLQFPLKVPFYV